MKNGFNKGLLVTVLLLGVASHSLASLLNIPNKVTLSKDVLKDKIKGGWAGQVIGCSYGGPTEFQYCGTMIQDYVPIEWNETSVEWYFDNFSGLFDDVYMDLTFVEVIDRLGVEAPADSFACAFANKEYQLWAANQMGRYNVLQGIKPPESGYWHNNPHADDIDFQIEADFIGLMYPGMPQSALKLADKVGHIMNYGDGWYGGVFVSMMYALAFVSDDVNFIVNKAIESIPEQSDFHKCIADVIKWHQLYPNDWKQTWFECERKWSEEVGSPGGVFRPYNIDAKINSAYVVIGLLYGNGDFFKSMDISTRCGQDSDCNPATVAGILGTMFGYNQIPEKWRVPLNSIGERNFDHVNISLNKIYSIGYKHALTMIKEEGGEVRKNDVVIKTQPISTAYFEKCFDGHYPIKNQSVREVVSNEYEYEFEGIGVVLGGYIQGSNDFEAKAEFYLNDQLVETAVLPAKGTKRRYELFYKYQLPKEKYTLRVKWLNPQEGASFHINNIVVYSDEGHSVDY